MPTQLNDAQRSVITSEASRIVVSAGAGSGKTRTLVERFVDRVLRFEAEGLDDVMRRILLITFTEKAAGELVERVRSRLLEQERPDLAREVDDSWISTIHGFCNRIVRRHALELGVDPGFAVFGETDAGLARTEAFESAAVSLMTDPDVAELLETWSVEDLRSSVLSGYDTVRSRGRLATDVHAAPPGDVAHALRVLIDETHRLLPEYRDQGQSATVLENTAVFERREALAGIMLASLATAGDLREPALAAATEELLGSKAARRGSDRAKEITEALNECLAGVRAAILDCRAAANSRGWLELLRAFDERYTHAKDVAGALDFEDMQLLTRRLWIQRPEAAQRYARQFVEVMIDEFQDTNQLQVEATGPVIGTRACYVGDVQQSIYGFRDADVTLLRDRFDAAVGDPDSQACRLTVNYRTHPDVLGAINEVFSDDVFSGQRHQSLDHDADLVRPDLWPQDRPRVEVIVADKSLCESGTWRDLEASALAGRLRSMVDQGLAEPGEIVVLTRAATTMGVYAAALEAQGFEVLAPAAGGLYGTREAADLRALLRVLANPLDTEGVLCLLAGGLGGLSDDALLAILGTRDGEGPWEMLGQASHLGLSAADTRRAALIHATVERLRAAQGHIRLADAILHAAAALGREGGLLGEATGWPNVQKVARLAAEFELSTPADPAAFLEYLSLREQFVKKEAVGVTASEGMDAVRLMTVHAAKGLEFPVVVVADLGHAGTHRTADVLLVPDREGLVAAVRGPKELRGDSGDGSAAWRAAAAAESETDRDEENRVFYVACTRAQRALLLTGACDFTKDPGDATMIERLLAVVGQGSDRIAVDIVEPSVSEADEESPAADVSGPEVLGEREASAPVDEWPEASDAEPLPEPIELAPPAEMSYTAFALYEACAYRFFAERMLRIGSVDEPRAEDPLALGSAVHAALELMARGEDPDDARLEALALACRVPASQRPRLLAAVEAVLESDVASVIRRGLPEVDFAVRVSDTIVRGSMDLLWRDGEHATVLDYKTGATWDAVQGRYRAQAEIYAFALLTAGVTSVEVRFVHVESGCQQESFRFGPDDAPAVRSRLGLALERMRAGDFPRLTAFNERFCADCPVSGGLCPVVHPGGKRGTRRS